MSHVWIRSTLSSDDLVCKYCSVKMNVAAESGMQCSSSVPDGVLLNAPDDALFNLPDSVLLQFSEAAAPRQAPSHWGMWCLSCSTHEASCDCSQPRLTRILRGRAR